MGSNSIDCKQQWDCDWKSRHQTIPCPLHDPNPEKNADEFRAALSQLTRIWVSSNAPFKLYGVVFPASLGKDLFAFLGDGKFELKLSGATFYGLIQFDGKTFHRSVDFDAAVFKEVASFQHVQFNMPASFVGTIAERDAAFADAIFGDSVYFDQMICQRAEFALAQFKSMASFRGKPDQILFQRATEVIFDEARFFRPDLVRLAYADFSRCSLLKADLRGIDFSGVRWGDKGKWSKHVVLYTREPEEQVRIELESAYRQIRQSYEDRRDYGRAGAFYFGEMEQKWKGSRGFLVTLYRLSSSYGHSPGRACMILLLLLAVDALLVALCGLKPVLNAAYILVEGNGSWAWVLIGAWWDALWFHVLKVVTFNQPMVVPRLPIGDVISSLMRILISVQVALFVLAVNRKFKR
jgi:hypothetical protein